MTITFLVWRIVDDPAPDFPTEWAEKVEGWNALRMAGFAVPEVGLGGANELVIDDPHEGCHRLQLGRQFVKGSLDLVQEQVTGRRFDH